MGNGLTLGFTDGTNTAGVLSTKYETSNGILRLYANNYGNAVGTSLSGSGLATVNKTVGIATDPEKSGVILHTSETPTFIGY